MYIITIVPAVGFIYSVRSNGGYWLHTLLYVRLAAVTIIKFNPTELRVRVLERTNRGRECVCLLFPYSISGLAFYWKPVIYNCPHAKDIWRWTFKVSPDVGPDTCRWRNIQLTPTVNFVQLLPVQSPQWLRSSLKRRNRGPLFLN